MLIVYNNQTKDIVGTFYNKNKTYKKKDVFPQYNSDNYVEINIDMDDDVLYNFNSYFVDDSQGEIKFVRKLQEPIEPPKDEIAELKQLIADLASLTLGVE